MPLWASPIKPSLRHVEANGISAHVTQTTVKWESQGRFSKTDRICFEF
ncbi:hypothetical protein SJ05684_c06280 [Sinorhizobium sojae CCBAU 05684]|uniref:Uncharacterized protein n=1 Tax=Sinorhizobium sojae CCBAU 05684 TaxID=716928 RepID=A0A249P8M7_9HYPH|nr:hypothetical protein SJ05684_c06280 [Sinorhizobium sojae CCBAU 05684]